MAKPMTIGLAGGASMEILYEDRSVLAIDKPAGWMVAPDSWDRTGRNLQLALVSSIRAGDWWAASRRIRYLRYVHRLDRETTGVLLFARSQGAVTALSRLFESRQVGKRYLAVVCGRPHDQEWICTSRLKPDPGRPGRMVVDGRHGLPAETHFRVLQRGPSFSLIEARPVTGRTHQIRVHLAEAGHPVAGDPLYGAGPDLEPGVTFSQHVDRSHAPTLQRSDASMLERPSPPKATPPLFGLRAVELAYRDPFQKRQVRIRAPSEGFLRAFGLALQPDFRPTAPA